LKEDIEMELIKEIRLAYSRDSVSMSWLNGREETTVKKIDCSAVFVIRSMSYGCTIASLAQMVESARQDFPDLKDEEVRVVHFGGDSFRGTWGIEFDGGSLSVAPPGWRSIPELHKVL
jgi:hypothetical protein